VNRVWRRTCEIAIRRTKKIETRRNLKRNLGKVRERLKKKPYHLPPARVMVLFFILI